jgi:hypothetical protein
MTTMEATPLRWTITRASTAKKAMAVPRAFLMLGGQWEFPILLQPVILTHHLSLLGLPAPHLSPPCGLSVPTPNKPTTPLIRATPHTLHPRSPLEDCMDMTGPPRHSLVALADIPPNTQLHIGNRRTTLHRVISPHPAHRTATAGTADIRASESCHLRRKLPSQSTVRQAGAPKVWHTTVQIWIRRPMRTRTIGARRRAIILGARLRV